jgi:hypothetical protein
MIAYAGRMSRDPVRPAGSGETICRRMLLRLRAGRNAAPAAATAVVDVLFRFMAGDVAMVERIYAM